MKLDVKTLNPRNFNNGDKITVALDTSISHEQYYYNNLIFNDKKIGGTSMKYIYRTLQPINNIKYMRKYYMIAHQYGTPFILQFGTSLFNSIHKFIENEIYGYAEKFFDIDINIRMVDVKSSGKQFQLPDTKNSVISTSNRKFDYSEHVKDIEEYISGFSTWDENPEILEYLNDRGVDLHHIISENRENNINLILQ